MLVEKQNEHRFPDLVEVVCKSTYDLYEVEDLVWCVFLPTLDLYEVFSSNQTRYSHY